MLHKKISFEISPGATLIFHLKTKCASRTSTFIKKRHCDTNSICSFGVPKYHYLYKTKMVTKENYNAGPQNQNWGY